MGLCCVLGEGQYLQSGWRRRPTVAYGNNYTTTRKGQARHYAVPLGTWMLLSTRATVDEAIAMMTNAYMADPRTGDLWISYGPPNQVELLRYFLIPEPTGMMLLALAGGAGMLRRR